MGRTNRFRTVLILVGAAMAFAFGCQGFLGIEDWTAKTTTVGDGLSCLRPSDCMGSQVCLFKTCSDPCASEKDCAIDSYCLRTDDGTACVSDRQAACTTNVCPPGTTCTDGRCLATCEQSSTPCPGGQRCESGVCVSGGADAGSSGGGGAGGSGGTPTGGAGGAGGVISPDASAGAGGTVDAGLDGPSTVPDGGDGTAVGTTDAPCTQNGAYACAGHAQRGQLLCRTGTWQANGTCGGSTLCDTTLGGSAGSCQPIVPECDTKTAGFRFCRAADADVHECGLDLVTESVVEQCTYLCSAGACAGECHPSDKRCKPGTVIPQTCDPNATWTGDTPCAFRCDDATGACIAAGCADGVPNGDETDKDCGGSCPGCAVGAVCKLDGDCVLPSSGHCVSGKCAAKSCTDGVKNGDETDKDCGGTCTANCLVGAGCAGDADCALPDSGHCSASKCVAATCGDGVKNQDEADKDCGGSCTADCLVGAACSIDADCVSVACLSSKCVTCKPSAKRCTGTSVETCSPAGDWGTAVPCTVTNGTPSCSGGACGIASCSTGYGNCDGLIPNGCETNLNAVDTCGTICATRVICSSTNGTRSCTNGVCGMSSCTSGYGDCGGTNDGCETNLNLVSSCGATCGAKLVCSNSNGTPSCTNGTCGMSACTGTFANCNTAANNGCETNLNSVLSCGTTCGNTVACAVTNGTPSCASGTCGIQSCNAGYGNCDGLVPSGCETSLNVPTACGTTCGNRIACSNLHGTASCTNGACGMSSCNSGYGNCGGTNDGCETNLNSIASCGPTCALKVTCGAGQICNTGTCATNNPYTVGFAAQLPNNVSAADNILYLQKLPPMTVDADVIALGMIGRLQNGAYAQFGLYEDNAGVPGTFIAKTGDVQVLDFPNQGQPTEDTPVPATAKVLAGKTYWVGAVFTGGATLFSRTNAAAPLLHRAGLTYGSAFPNPYVVGTTLSSVEWNFYITVRTVPQ